jgi:hypothetical protein
MRRPVGALPRARRHGGTTPRSQRASKPSRAGWRIASDPCRAAAHLLRLASRACLIAGCVWGPPRRARPCWGRPGSRCSPSRGRMRVFPTASPRRRHRGLRGRIHPPSRLPSAGTRRMDVVRLDGVGGERQRWFVYASFGHAAADLDRPVSPADDERDNVTDVSRTPSSPATRSKSSCRRCPGSATPSPTPRLALTTVDVRSGVRARDCRHVIDACERDAGSEPGPRRHSVGAVALPSLTETAQPTVPVVTIPAT